MRSKKKQFCPYIYAEWGELFDAITEKERSEILLAITKFPEYEPENVPIWNFIKSQLQKDYELFVEKCEKNGEISRNYWQNKKTNDTECNRTDTDGHPKLKHKPLTKTKTKTETKTEINQDENQLENQDANQDVNQDPNQVVDIDIDKYKLLYKAIEKIYGYPFNLKSKSSDIVIKEIISDKEFGLCVEDVLKHFKYKYNWGDKGKPYLDWLFQDSINWFKVKQDCIEKGGNRG